MIAGGSLLAVLLGLVLGYFAATVMADLSFIGQIYLTALKLVVVPLIFSAIIVGISTFGDGKKSLRVLVKTLIYVVVSTLLAIVVAVILALVFDFSAPQLRDAGGPAPEGLITLIPSSLGGLLSAILSPKLFAVFSQGRFLGLILFLIAFTVALLGVRGYSSRNILFQFFRTLHQASLTLIQWLLYITPIGILFLVGTAVARGGADIQQLWSGLGTFTLAMLIALLVHAVIVLPILMRLLADQPIVSYLRDLIPGLTSGVATASSMSSLPLMYDGVSQQSDVDQRAAAIMLPLGHSINMHGTAIYAVLATALIAGIYGVELSIMSWLLIVVGAFFVAIGTPGLPGAAALSVAVIFDLVDFPPAAYAGLGLLFVIDWLYDRMRTPVNLWGNAVGAAAIANTFEFMTAGGKSGGDRGRSDRTRDSRDRRGGRDRTSDSRSPRGGRDDRRDSSRGRGRGSRDDRPQRDDRRGDQRPDRRRTERSSDRGDRTEQRGRPSAPPKEEPQPREERPQVARKDSPFAVSRDSEPALAPTQLERADRADRSDEPSRPSRQRSPERAGSAEPRGRGRGRGGRDDRGPREDRPQRGDRRRSDRDRDQTERQPSDSDQPERGRPSEVSRPTDTGTPDRANVAAQLADYKSRRAQQEQEVPEPRPQPREPKADQQERQERPADKKPEPMAEDGSLQREAFSRTVEETVDEDRTAESRAASAPRPKPEPPEEKPQEKPREQAPQPPAGAESEDRPADDTGDQPIEFGRRGRGRKSAPRPSGSDQPRPAKPSETEVETEPTEFDKEDMEFGRGKRKPRKG